MAIRREKYRQAVLYFLHACDNRHLGVVKLMKLLYYLDFDHFERFRSSVTGDVYRRFPHGPLPDAANDVLQRMVLDGDIVPQVVTYGDYKQQRFEPQEHPELSIFSESERMMLDEVAKKWADVPSKTIEDASHNELPWLATSPYEVIPYRLAFHRHRGDSLTPQQRADMIRSAIGSLRVEGIDVSFDDAEPLLDPIVSEPEVTID